MSDMIHDEVFALVDAIYNDVYDQPIDDHIKKTLLTAAKYLDAGKMPAQVIAAKTMNGIFIWTMDGHNPLGSANGDRINRLMRLARSGGYKWTTAGVGDLRVQF
ncbi:hypothetical protein [Lactiplantibacillus mudanjiangensis]|uniref:Uncharacterized protein n=1 Tax=Lactiplantibacillus mudanjiangensis TaxID=1296538 RepID=A0A660E617_9LACO|nr:hypothetical protein [Lactiplantibacillus mudanjiangensis]VDG18084.1 hypothetical protein [Lactobacillus curvatus] [Lactiplantibacillus mudanjiangensis]VDG24746.1 hypothetical protein [Lactobacillus curvatus] [Lactiplantibacillus mudanjiangensis]VDG28507.1 hypothetical protein [Lactobacillus curvatus] [Lactiplantibacillus mudanjiangensis]VDG31341.1 hypothetical protein [Lactobacillus curvatus] [Lactiplantibacillus mudanjiangensis]